MIRAKTNRGDEAENLAGLGVRRRPCGEGTSVTSEERCQRMES